MNNQTKAINNKIYQRYQKKNYINKWKKSFNKNWKLYNIQETLIEFEDDIKIIENYFRVKQKLYINEFQYILV
jgi:hypothetical protein